MITKHNVINGLIWKFLERFGAQFVSFVVSIILARLLLPEEYGQIALTTIFISLASVLITYGLGTGLVQKQNTDELDYSTVFYFNLLLGIGIYLLIYFISPWIENYFSSPGLTNILRVVSLIIIISSFNNVQNAYLTKNLLFKKYFFAGFISIIFSSILGVLMAYNEYGVWALVAQNVSSQLILTICLWFSVKWRPKRLFSFNRLMSIYKYAWKILVVGLSDTIYNEIISIMIGRNYTNIDLGYYNKGQQVPRLIISNINSTIDSVMFPVLSKAQDDLDQIKRIISYFIRTTTFIVAPISIGLIVVSENILTILLTEKWASSSIFLQIAAVYYFFLPINTANLQALKAIGKSNILLYLNLIKITLSILLLYIFVDKGVIALSLIMVITIFISTIINSLVISKFTRYSFKNHIIDICPTLFISMVMGLLVWLVNLFNFKLFLETSIQLLIGVGSYLILANITKNPIFIKSKEYIVTYLTKNTK